MENKVNWWIKFKFWVKTPEGKKKFILILVFSIIILALFITIYLRYFSNKTNSDSTKSSNIFPGKTDETPTIKTTVSLLDGLKYNEDISNRHPLAVMIENHPDARPQSGLDKAKIIYEAIAEGGITRFMTIFGPDSASKVGPVRSARTYYLDWALEYDAFYAHVGGNIDALDLIPKIGIKDLDQFRYGTEAYWRVPQAGKATEHTMFADTDKLYSIAKNNKWDMTANFTPLSFKDDVKTELRPTTQSVTINFSTNTYKVKWQYNNDDNNYERYMAGIAHKDAVSGKILTAKNVIIQEVNRQPAVTRINEQGWTMQTTGTGKAKIIIDGKVIDGTWKKKDRNSRTTFADNNGDEIKFNAGTTWYEIVPPGTDVTVS